MAKEVVSFELQDNSEEVLKALADQIEKALTAVGIQGEANAVAEITKSVYETPESPGYKRTGRLRNSLTWTKDESAVYIGTNVEYAPVVELGTAKRRAKPYLRPAVNNHVDEYRQIIEEALKNG